MSKSIRQLLGKTDSGKEPAIPKGRRVYAVGDIHGRLDLFDAMIAAIERDEAQAPAEQSTVILLGDLVDRGPDSAGVIKRARKWKKKRELRILGGNHEEMFLESFRRKDVLQHFLRFGGKETLLSYGIQPRARTKSELAALQQLMAAQVPAKDVEFIRGFEDMAVIGDYLFVHAGIAPGKSLKKQSTGDLRWIREPFLSHDKPHSHFVVHGHTIYQRPQIRSNRIGIDTGAFNTGRLTALVLEGTARRIIETKVKKGVVRTLERKVEA